MALGKEGHQECAQAPHWMRLLEEKYQRLHAKILNQAAKFTHRRASNITTRLLKESRRKRATSVPGANQTDLGKDQEENPSQFDGAEINEAIQAESCNETFAQVDCVQNYDRKQTRFGHRPFTQEGTRSRVFSDGTQGESSYSTTPQSSGVATRISSAFPRTRLSSAYDVSLQSPRHDFKEEEDDSVINSEGHALQLDQALRLQIGILNEEWAVGVRDRPPKTAHPNLLEGDEDDETENEKMSIHCQTDRVDVDAMNRRRRRHLNRPVKTSVSRVSHKTSKSCPAAFGQQGDLTIGSNIVAASVSLSHSTKQHLPTSVVPLTAKGVQEGRMRVFARMSQEARHAIDETLKEMKMEEDANKEHPSYTEDDDDNNITAGDMKGNNGNDENDNDNNNYESENASNSSLRNNVSAAPTRDLDDKDTNKRQEHRNMNNYVIDNVSSDVSIASGNGSDYATRETRDVLPFKTFKNQPNFNNTNNNRPTNNGHANNIGTQRSPNVSRRLPQINQGIPVCQDGFPTPHPRLPSIRRANLAFRENTFEITAPDFDIRFRDIITCHKGGRDTPPLDVRQHSIEKCQQWLVQHTPRR